MSGPAPGRPAVVRRAPGKLFVAGEYAVVDSGNPAILAAVDRYVTVTVSGSASPGVLVSSDLAAHPVRRRWDGGRLAADGGRERGGPVHVLSAVETVAALLAEHGLPRPGLELSVASALHADGRKFGLGSSGAVTVASVAAVAAYCGLELTRADVYRLALLATARIDPEGSGGDLAASTWGGWLLYRAPDRGFVLDLARERGTGAALRAPWPGFAVRRLPPPAGLSLQAGWTGRPASTARLVSGLHRRPWRGTCRHRRFTAAVTDVVHAMAGALEAGDGPGVLHQVRRARQELARLDDEAGLGVFTDKLRALCEAAEAAGGAAKPSGAGGGDCGIALLDAAAPRHISYVHRRWTEAGVLPLPVRVAMEGIQR
ncbi:phosphomevalonate kinase [Streptomyces populi]|uniref:Phosphomevalonate kinase n=1 Tax=Streptomyces populi TaxID=2058924 RepID=A0A2I0SH18_9ACTN|nr:phosphomevalonate kinase [Streptomyces populi]PKT69227.1 phosphomevalonate kinase [Streptomyces populi]